jgi:hypothetical protein
MQHKLTFEAEEKPYILTYHRQLCLDRPNSRERKF